MVNDLVFLTTIVHRLEMAHIPCVVFGGWAEELVGTIAPRPHTDVDLLYIAHTFDTVDAFIHANTDLVEIKQKHFPHKRAFTADGILVEIILLQPQAGSLVTNFWDEYQLHWPPIQPITVHAGSGTSLAVSPTDTIQFYRSQYSKIDTIRRNHLPHTG